MNPSFRLRAAGPLLIILGRSPIMLLICKQIADGLLSGNMFQHVQPTLAKDIHFHEPKIIWKWLQAFSNSQTLKDISIVGSFLKWSEGKHEQFLTVVESSSQIRSNVLSARFQPLCLQELQTFWTVSVMKLALFFSWKISRSPLKICWESEVANIFVEQWNALASVQHYLHLLLSGTHTWI